MANFNLTVNVLKLCTVIFEKKPNLWGGNAHFKSLMKAICQQFHTSFAHNLGIKGFPLAFFPCELLIIGI